MPTGKETYNTLEEIQLRRDQLSEAIEHDSEQIGALWNGLFKKNEQLTKGEQVAALINNSILAIDAFLLVRKLMKSYSGIFSFFGKNKKKRN
jgi:hypothetical protein